MVAAREPTPGRPARPAEPGLRRAAALALSAWALMGAGGCVEAPPDREVDDMPFARLACLGETPACLASCGGDVASGATCDDGVWRCDTGIREDLCCDALETPERCPTWGERCAAAGEGRASEPCDAGYTCVRSQAFPVPPGSGQDGICRLGDWRLAPFDDCDADALTWADALVDPTRRDLVTPIQLEGVIGVAPLCEDHQCMDEDPCCQRCQGSYTLALVTSAGMPIEIGLRTETLACTGSNCGFSCAPLQPGRRYRVWGLWDPTASGGSGTLFYGGHCDG